MQCVLHYNNFSWLCQSLSYFSREHNVYNLYCSSPEKIFFGVRLRDRHVYLVSKNVI
uniref:Uncharacterized protein n=1 Tax=Rhizophora mucronata TaxID=61149 RepID=A0A2P2Q497_RHIMU